jgi:hypothetical protein
MKRQQSPGGIDEIFRLQFSGWSPSFGKITINPSWYVRHNDIDTFQQRFEKIFRRDVEDQMSRYTKAKSQGIAEPIELTGQDIQEISHLFLDKTGLDVMIRDSGSIDEVLEKICEFHHRAHDQSESYEGFNMIEADIEEYGKIYTQVISLIDNKSIIEYDLRIGSHSSDKRDEDDSNQIHLIAGSHISINEINIPETVIEGLIGKDLKTLVSFDHPVDNRKIRRIANTDSGLKVEIFPEYVHVSDLIDQISL